MGAQPVTATTTRPFCAAVSSASGEPLRATASRVDHWLLVEYRGAWPRKPLTASALSPELKEHLLAQVAGLPHVRLLFVRKPSRQAQSGARAFVATSRPGEERLLELGLERLDDLLGVELGPVLAGAEPAAVSEEPLWIVCSHGKRDRCCALRGRPLYDALTRATDSMRVWQSTHVGGDRFAGNVVVLPHGLYYGRAGPADAAGLVAAHAGGRIDLDRYRGRSAWPFPVQAAEHALREAEGLAGIGDVELVEAARRDDGSRRVRFRTPSGAVHELRVVESLADEPAYLTCDSAEPRRARRWRVTAHDVVSR